MDIVYSSRKLAATMNSQKLTIAKWGDANARKIQQRLLEIRAADSLQDLCTLPQARCHQLVDNRDGQFAVDVKHPFRLVFEPVGNPVPLKPEGGIDTSKIKSVRIIGVEDYHG